MTPDPLAARVHAQEQRITQLCEAYEEAFLRAEQAEATLARVHALIAQWRSDAESALYAARMFVENETEEEWYESRAMGRAQTYKECAFDLDAALAAAPQRVLDEAFIDRETEWANKWMRVVDENSRLTAALQEIADGMECPCECTHDTEDCCARADVYCPTCIAAAALAAAPLKETSENLNGADGIKAAPPCQGCGGPHPFDTSVPSVRWNAVIRGAGLPDYLCLTCIVSAFVRAGESFTADLCSGGDGPHAFDAIEVRVRSQPALDAQALSEENTTLRMTRDRYRVLLADLVCEWRALDTGIRDCAEDTSVFSSLADDLRYAVCHAEGHDWQPLPDDIARRCDAFDSRRCAKCGNLFSTLYAIAAADDDLAKRAAALAAALAPTSENLCESRSPDGDGPAANSSAFETDGPNGPSPQASRRMDARSATEARSAAGFESRPTLSNNQGSVDYDALDPGIRETVRFLNLHSFVTTDSGDGVSKPPDNYVSGAAIPCPNVACIVRPEQLQTEADRLAGLLGNHWHIEATYFPADGHAVLLATEGDPAEQYAKQVAASKPTCAGCEYLTPFELADDIFTCPSVNIRIHRESIHTFGCNLFEPKAALAAALAPKPEDK